MTEALFDPGPFGAKPQLFADERYAAEEIPATLEEAAPYLADARATLACAGCEARPCRCAEYGTEAQTLPRGRCTGCPWNAESADACPGYRGLACGFQAEAF